MTPTTQPKLTDAEVLAIMQGCSNALCTNKHAPLATANNRARTAVAGIIAERDALLRACERKNAALGVACDRMASLSTRAHDYFLQQYATDVAYNKAAIAYTGTEE